MTRRWLQILLGALSVSSALLPSIARTAELVPIEVDLGGIGHELVVDPVRDMLYVSLRDRGEVAFVSTQDFRVVDRVNVGSVPLGLAQSIDGTRLFVALNGAGAVAVIDIETRAVSMIDVRDQFGATETWDVIEAQPGRLFVSSNPCSGGFATLVQVRLDQGNSVSPAAGGRIIRCGPNFGARRNGNELYVGQFNQSPEELFKLDLTQPDAPVVLEAPFGSVIGTTNLEVAPDGSLVHLAGGQILESQTLTQVGFPFFPLLMRYGSTPGVFYGARVDQLADFSVVTTIRTFDQLSLAERNVSTIRCNRLSTDFGVLPGDRGFVTLGDGLCIGLVAPSVGAATLDLTQATDREVVGSEHCVSAGVADAGGAALGGARVAFSVSGASSASGFGITDSGGEASFCYTVSSLPGTDAIAASTDSGSMPTDSLLLTIDTPSSTRGCKVDYHGSIVTAGGTPAEIDGRASVQPKGVVRGNQTFRELVSTLGLQVDGMSVDSLSCEQGAAVLFGHATLGDGSPAGYRIDLRDGGKGKTTSDFYQLRLTGGFDSGLQLLRTGKVDIRP